MRFYPERMKQNDGLDPLRNIRQDLNDLASLTFIVVAGWTVLATFNRLFAALVALLGS